MIIATPATTHFRAGSTVRNPAKNTKCCPRFDVKYTGQSYRSFSPRKYPTGAGVHATSTGTALMYIMGNHGIRPLHRQSPRCPSDRKISSRASSAFFRSPMSLSLAATSSRSSSSSSAAFYSGKTTRTVDVIDLAKASRTGYLLVFSSHSTDKPTVC